MLMNNNEYLDLVQTIKQEIQQAQYKATLLSLIHISEPTRH